MFYCCWYCFSLRENLEDGYLSSAAKYIVIMQTRQAAAVLLFQRTCNQFSHDAPSFSTAGCICSFYSQLYASNTFSHKIKLYVDGLYLLLHLFLVLVLKLLLLFLSISDPKYTFNFYLIYPFSFCSEQLCKYMRYWNGLLWFDPIRIYFSPEPAEIRLS